MVNFDSGNLAFTSQFDVGCGMIGYSRYRTDRIDELRKVFFTYYYCFP